MHSFVEVAALVRHRLGAAEGAGPSDADPAPEFELILVLIDPSSTRPGLLGPEQGTPAHRAAIRRSRWTTSC